MHIIGILIAVIGGLAFLLWRLNRAAQAGKEIVETAKDAHAFVRRHHWQSKLEDRAIEDIDDPMLAAAAIMFLAVRSDRDVTNEDRLAMERESMRVFDISQDDATALIGQAGFAVKDVTDEVRWSGKLGQVIVETCTDEERSDVISMIMAVNPDGKLTPNQGGVVNRYREIAGLSASAGKR